MEVSANNYLYSQDRVAKKSLKVVENLPHSLPLLYPPTHCEALAPVPILEPSALRPNPISIFKGRRVCTADEK